MAEETNKDGKGKKISFTVKYEIEETPDGADVNFKLENSEEDRLFAYMVTLWDLSQLLDKVMTDDRVPPQAKADFLTAAKIVKDMTQACKIKVEEKNNIGEKLSMMDRLKKLFQEVSGELGDENSLKEKLDSGMKPSKIILGGDIPDELKSQLEDALREQFGPGVDIGNMSESETKDFLDKHKPENRKEDGEVDFDDLNSPSKDKSSDIDF